MITITKYRYLHSLLLAKNENLFYDSKNQSELPPLMAQSELRLTAYRLQFANVNFTLCRGKQ
ncbi:MAG TPA: hypothetical protein DCX28_08610 [Enterobacteriaceae bacterium]|nr:hypothetical protein [Enterobacteriaceae bacterium]